MRKRWYRYRIMQYTFYTKFFAVHRIFSLANESLPEPEDPLKLNKYKELEKIYSFWIICNFYNFQYKTCTALSDTHISAFE